MSTGPGCQVNATSPIAISCCQSESGLIASNTTQGSWCYVSEANVPSLQGCLLKHPQGSTLLCRGAQSSSASPDSKPCLIKLVYSLALVSIFASFWQPVMGSVISVRKPNSLQPDAVGPPITCCGSQCCSWNPVGQVNNGLGPATQVSDPITCNGDSCGSTVAKSKTIGWAVTSGPSVDFGAVHFGTSYTYSQSVTTGTSYTCTGQPGTTVCVMFQPMEGTGDFACDGSVNCPVDDISAYAPITNSDGSPAGQYMCANSGCSTSY